MNEELILFAKEMGLQKQCESFIRRNEIPKVCDEVLTLVAGYSGSAGVQRVVIGYEYFENNNWLMTDEYSAKCKFIVLVNPSEPTRKCLCEVEKWWNQIYVLN